MARQRSRRLTSVMAVLVLVAAVGGALVLRPWCKTLVVWSNEGAYEAQKAFAQQFSARNGCKVTVIRMSPQQVVEGFSRQGRRPDVVVGHSGPAWAWLQEHRLLSRGPEFFGVDPFVIVYRPDPELQVTDVSILGKGFFSAIAPDAPYPTGRAVSSLLQAVARTLGIPSLAENYYFSVKAIVKTAEQLWQPLSSGKAYIALTRKTRAISPQFKELEIVPVPEAFLLRMDHCRDTLAHGAAVVAGGQLEELASRYIDALLSPETGPLLEAQGYYPAADERCNALRPVMTVLVRPEPHPYLDHLACELMADEEWEAALGCWLQLLHGLGPSPYDAKACYQAGLCALQLGLKSGAGRLWRRCVQHYAIEAPAEWEGPLFNVGVKPRDPKDLDTSHWAAQAQEALGKLGPDARVDFAADLPADDVGDFLANYPPGAARVKASDLYEGSRRSFAAAEDELRCGAYTLGGRDYTRVFGVTFSNSLEAMSLFRAGECQWLAGNRAAAMDLWAECASLFAGTEWGDLAGRAVYVAGSTGKVIEDKGVPTDAMRILSSEIEGPTYDTMQGRGLNAASWLFKARDLPGALAECFKVLHSVYPPPKATASEEGSEPPPDARPQARYWAGILCCWMGQPDAAVIQWRLLARDYPGGPWAASAESALAQVQKHEQLSADQRKAVQAAFSVSLGREMNVGVPPFFDRDARYALRGLSDRVPDKGQAVIWHHIGLELFLCREWSQALEAFLRVLTVANFRGEAGNRWQDEALYFAGVCLQHLGKSQRAEARWQELRQRFPDSRWSRLVEPPRRAEIQGQGSDPPWLGQEALP